MARVGAVLRVTVRTVGELLVTFSVLTALFIVYQLYYTNVVGRQVMSDEVDAMHRQWTAAASRPAPAPPSPTDPGWPVPPASSTSVIAASPAAPDRSAASPSTGTPVSVVQPPRPSPADGSALAILHIPRLGTGAADSGTPVLEGIGLDVLNKAAGHYPGTALPGQLGTFAVAGHRKTHGEPFRHLDQMRTGDLVYVETATAWYTYRIDAGPVIVQPTDVHVIDAVPGKSLITLTTCNPWWSSTQRMIVTGHLVASRPRT